MLNRQIAPTLSRDDLDDRDTIALVVACFCRGSANGDPQAVVQI